MWLSTREDVLLGVRVGSEPSPVRMAVASARGRMTDEREPSAELWTLRGPGLARRPLSLSRPAGACCRNILRASKRFSSMDDTAPGILEWRLERWQVTTQENQPSENTVRFGALGIAF